MPMSSDCRCGGRARADAVSPGRHYTIRYPRARTYSSALRARDAFGLRNFTDSKSRRRRAISGWNSRPWKTFISRSPPGRRLCAREIHCQVHEVHRAVVVHVRHAHHVGGHVGHHKVALVRPRASPGALASAASSLKSPWMNSTPGIAGISRRSRAITRPLATQNPGCVLAPAAGRRAEIHHDHPGPQQPVGALDFLELEGGTRAPALVVRALHVGSAACSASQRAEDLVRLVMGTAE